MCKIKVLKSFRATPVGKMRRIKFDLPDEFKILKLEDVKIILKSLYSGDVIRLSIDFLKHLQDENILTTPSRYPFGLKRRD